MFSSYNSSIPRIIDCLNLFSLIISGKGQVMIVDHSEDTQKPLIVARDEYDDQASSKNNRIGSATQIICKIELSRLIRIPSVKKSKLFNNNNNEKMREDDHFMVTTLLKKIKHVLIRKKFLIEGKMSFFKWSSKFL